MAETTLSADACIAGGGPAGIMLGYLLARAGVHVVMLEKHADFFRDFRGDTIHPSTLDVLSELGLLDGFLKTPHQEIERLSAQIGADHVSLVDFRHVPARCKYIALAPQWDFLNFLSDQGRRYPGFDLRMSAEAVDILEEDGRIVGVRVKTPNGPLLVRASLTVACDGRHSTLREKAGLASDDYGAPMDVLWFRISREAGDGPETFGHVEAGRMLIMIDRSDYWQCAYLVSKDGFPKVKAEGLPAFRAGLREMSPFLGDRVEEVKDWDSVQLLTVKVDRLRRWWRRGLLCIGDAAHAMSPIGGVGVNLAVQDAVAAANRLAAPLRAHRVTDADLAAIQARRERPVRRTQQLQLTIQNRVIAPVLRSHLRPRAPALMKLFDVFPLLRRLPARFIGIGFLPEHVETAEAASAKPH
jgi:2-polyprenyl-6-methoxyphenol hydroxylase-like FAD-dependent oxidoreductase